MAKKKMSEEEKRDWDSLYNYVKFDILGYDENQALSSTMVLRLKGLLTNKFIENNNTKATANYSYKVVLNTFKYCKQDIDKALRIKSFENEMHRFLYIVKIVEKNINTVYMKMKQHQKAKEEAENTAVEVINYTGAGYQRKTKETNNELLNDLW